MARSWGSQAGFDNGLTRSLGRLRDEKLFAGTVVTALCALFGLAGSLVMYAAGPLGPATSHFAYRVGAIARREATQLRRFCIPTGFCRVTEILAKLFQLGARH
jgi:hypothetical protein